MRAGDLLGGRYRLNERIAAGGMGTVWRGHDTRLNRAVAVKILHPNLSEDASFRHRFETEARVVGSLESGGIVNVYDFGEHVTDADGDVAYLVMQLIDGESLAALLAARERLSVNETLDILATCADALSVAHRSGIIHRDIKPGNILIDRAGNAKIVDFGIARTAGQDGMTSTGVVMGTVAYVAPEQLRGAEPNPSGDLYALGVVGYQALAGRKPFENDVAAATLIASLQEKPPPLPGDVPEPVSRLIMRALEKDPQQRWRHGGEFAAACRAVRSGSAAPASPFQGAESPLPQLRTASEPGPITPTEVDTRGKPLMWTTATLVAVVLLAGLALIVRPWEGGNPAQAGDDGTTSQQHSPHGKRGDASSSSTSDSSSSASSSSRTDDDDQDSPDPPKEKILIPDVSGMHKDKAMKKLADKGFTNVGIKSGNGCYVRSQYPNPGTKVKSDAYLALALLSEKEKPCPDE